MLYIHDSLLLQLQTDLHLLRWQWRGPMQLPAFQLAFNQLMNYSLRYGVTHMLADTSTMPPVGTREQAWLSEAWLPRARAMRLQHLALVLPASLHNQLVVEHVVQDGRFYLDTQVHFFSDDYSALDWLANGEAVVAAMEHEWHSGRARSQPEGQLAGR
ncbi:hypothetical protein [Hymenobacter yonginensis]|uniref:STAS/SEC14 domain-containing protein n=1 Tax=Hymenobacter yonginensis TaxID=748197 RepID=A0ABY7PQA4_9BACT|nr:hypothetical protein [Hymenobacter yonginensis]WBO84413.1 hypothetical protein O9Z63_18845 [Hymenobacter yonginensis]